jgi:hypothetical protein
MENETMLEALREAYTDLGEPFSTVAYAAWRERKLSTDPTARLRRAYPTYPTVCGRFGSWAAAREAAAIAAPTTEPTHRGRMSDEVMLDAIREAQAEVGEPISSRAYETWRKKRFERDPFAKLSNRYPGRETITIRFGSWAEALASAAAQQDDDPDAGVLGVVA